MRGVGSWVGGEVLNHVPARAPRRSKLRPYIDGTGQIRSDIARAVLAEFFGTMLFQMFGGSAPAKDTTAPAANGFALVALGA
jgi:hypothetical protein